MSLRLTQLPQIGGRWGWKCSYTADSESGSKAASFGFPSHHGAYGSPRRAIYGETARIFGCSIELWESDLVLLGAGCEVSVERRALWDALLAASVGASPWIVGGDFNTVLSPDERSGGSALSGIAMSDFHDAIANCPLVDAGYVGSPYTWYSRRLRQRLDQVLISNCWITVFPKMQVAHLELSQSDHRGLLVEAECTVERKVLSFRFQHMWTTHSEFLGVVRRNWQYPTVGSGMMRLQPKLTRLKHCLKEWNKTIFGNVFDNVVAAERGLKEADEAYDQDPCDRTLMERNRCSAELVQVLAQEGTFWRQKAGIRWAKDGERNTRYFDSLVQKRRFRGTIFGIQHEGEYLTDPIAIKDSAASFFQRLLTAEPVFPEEMDSEHLEDGLTDEDRRFLCVMPTLEEVREAVFSIDPDSVAGQDGFGAVFFHTCWEIVAEDVFGAVTEFFRGEKMPKSFTATTISIIPKTASPTCWSEYRPISLLNGEHAGFFHSTRGLRQGDPLSPALFVLAADYLSRGLERLFAAHPTMFYQAPGLIRVSHLAYADDLMIFTTTCRQNMELLRDFLRAYERVSGQLINGSKSFFIVGRQASSLQTQAVQDVLGYQLKHLPITYLGVPLYKGNRKACLFDPIISRLRDLLQGWAMTNLSHGGSLDSKCVAGHSIASASGDSPAQHHLCRIQDVAERFIFWTLGEGSVSFCTIIDWREALAQLVHRDNYTMESVRYYWHEGDWNVPRILRIIPMLLHRPSARFLLQQAREIELCGRNLIRGISRRNLHGKLFDNLHLSGSNLLMSGTVPCGQLFQFSCDGFFKIESQWTANATKGVQFSI
ncbi:hypothetical protein Sango_2891400 [Sesamum angolense]|uniref:Reverse transcriptase domain-containing protein n=1 Tax=Sesamum angolense TaxID=2727404 RepID=A0AAE1T686_9LAMI|nr:hypothetical protein Sango_2891400 [Sesamum angolense]